MNTFRKPKLAAWLISFWIGIYPLQGMTEDIDLFVGSSAGTSDNPNVLFVVDNTANWTPQFSWEKQALETVFNGLSDSVNVGLMFYSETGAPNTNTDGGYVRYAVRQMTAANKATLGGIIAGLDVNADKSNSGKASLIMDEAYRYLASKAAYGGAGKVKADLGAFDGGAYRTGTGAGNYVSPVATTCQKNFIIYLSNGSPSDNASDITTATTHLSSFGGNTTQISLTPSGSQTILADEWARFMYGKDLSSGLDGDQLVTTYTIDVLPKTTGQGPAWTAMLNSMAKVGGGKYFTATDLASLTAKIQQILVEIQSVNSTFASASLPINATNRAQNENQVFIGMFRPDPQAKPRWFGNVKRYQLIADAGGNIQLGDVNGQAAINNNTGFITECAVSWWTTDALNAPGKADNLGYWNGFGTAGRCVGANAYSDLPDGPQVEKGAVAEVLRKGNNPPTTDTAPTWSENRVVYTGSTLLQTFNTTNTGLSDTLVKWIRGQDTEDDNGNGALGSQTPSAFATETRASVHGDVVHSRPLPVNYGLSGVTVYYGANDGMLRAVDAVTGKEKWAFVAPEFNSRLDRLRAQTPNVCFPSDPTYNVATGTCSSGATQRDYFWDGSIGLYQTANNSSVWIYPTMRRGGRMIYALDVSSSTAPIIKWRFGCPNLTNDTGCTSGSSTIGQTWSIPNVAYLKGYSSATPIAVVGGGYDNCEDANTSSPSCGAAKGNVVYVLNADSGAVVASFPTLRSVPSDIALVDMDFDGSVDYGYVGDTGGNLYRISFSSYDSTTGTYTMLSPSGWTIARIAYTNGGGRKFLFSPSLFGGAGKIWVALGSGDREHPLQTQYPYTSGINNRFYVYRDCLPSPASASSSLAGGDNLDDSSLMNASSATSPVGCDATKTLATNCSTNKGWYMDLNNGTGEQTVTSSVISGGMVTFSTNRPIPAAAGTCATSLGEARGYWLDLFNGSGAIGVSGSCGGATSATFVGGGLPPSPVVGTVPINGVPTTVVIGAVQKSGGASSPISPQKAISTSLPSRKRVYNFIKSGN